METPREQLMYYLGQCEEGLSSIIIIGMFEETEDGDIVTVTCSPNSVANLCFMLMCAERDILK